MEAAAAFKKLIGVRGGEVMIIVNILQGLPFNCSLRDITAAPSCHIDEFSVKPSLHNNHITLPINAAI